MSGPKGEDGSVKKFYFALNTIIKLSLTKFFSRVSFLPQQRYAKWALKRAPMKEAEKIAKKKKHKIIRVISGIGVREYYKKLGYRLDKQKIYMEKPL